ncbi:MAG: hypothetical protein GY861_10330, partial [bacterium]|nr:hypothetical protein [bacterium]
MSDKLTTLKDFLEKIIGKEAEFSLEHRIFNATSAFNILTITPFSLFMFVTGAFNLGVLFLVGVVYFAYVYYLAFYSKRLELALMLYMIAVIILINIMWLVDGGVTGSTPFFMGIMLVMAGFTSEHPKYYIIFLVFDILFLSIFENQLQEMIIFEMTPTKLSATSALIICLGYTSVLCMLYRQLMTKRLDDTFYDVTLQIQEESSTIDHSADTLSQSGDDLLKSALRQKTAIEELAVTTEQLSATAEQNKQLSRDAVDTIKQTEGLISNSKTSINTLVSKMEEMQNSSEQIQNINNVVDEIAYQTNILSLNAMIEASRSDEQGGFKVVALEVKRLAEQATDAANDINNLLNENFKSVQSGVELTEEMSSTFTNISDHIQPMVYQIQNIADASFEQNEAIRQI